MLVANKVDKVFSKKKSLIVQLASFLNCKQQNAEVEKEEGNQFARSKGMMFIQCSAKTKVGIYQAFDEVVQKVTNVESVLVHFKFFIRYWTTLRCSPIQPLSAL